MSTGANHYHTLGIEPGASAAEVKHAFRTAAKTAHPDAGGSAAAMEAINEAYRVLGDSLARSSYDFDRSQAARTHSSAAQSEPGQTQSQPNAATPRKAGPARYVYSRPRANPADVRRYVGAQLGEFGLLALLLGVALSFISTKVQTAPSQLLVGTISFVPLYWLVLQLVYLALPDFKFRNYYTLRHPIRVDAASRYILLATLSLWLPLGPLWTVIVQIIAKLA